MNRWVRLVAAVVAMIQIANLQYGWTLFTKPLMKANGWTAADVGWGIAIFIALETWAMPVCGFLIDKYGLRPLMTIAGFMCAAGWAGIGMTQSLTTMYLLYAFAGFGAAIVYCGSIGVALKWFPDRRGFAAGIIAAGFCSGSALFAALLTRWIATYGHATTFLYTGILHGLLIVAAAQFLGGTGVPLAFPAQAGKAVVRRQTQDFTPPEMMRSMITPENMQRAMGMMVGMGGMQGMGGMPQGMMGGMPPGMMGGMPPGMFMPPGMNAGGMPTQPVGGSPSATTEDPKVKYATELAQIKEMGFSDEAKIVQVLQQTNGNVALALERLFGEM